MEANPLLKDPSSADDDGLAFPKFRRAQSVLNLLGERVEIEQDDGSWLYAFVFPVAAPGKEDQWAKPMPNAVEAAQKLFKRRTWDDLGACSFFRDHMTKEEFHSAVRRQFVEVLSGPMCGFRLGTMFSIDEDEVFLLVDIPDEETQQRLATQTDIRAPLRPEAYTEHDPCPKMQLVDGKFVGDTYCPAYVQFETRLSNKLQPFREVDLLRICRKRMRQFFNIEVMESEGILVQSFPVHRKDTLARLHDQGWNDIMAACQYPGTRHSDAVRNYLGEEIAFFFHWFNFYTRLLLIPAPLGLLLAFRKFFLSEDNQSYVQIGYAAVICCWAVCFSSLYTQRSNLKILQWGMQNWDQVASVRPDFQEALRGSFSEKARRGFHAFLACLMMAETLIAVFYISSFHVRAVQADPDTLLYGIPAEKAARLSKYLITIHIKLADLFWTPFAAWLSERENWKTDTQVKLETVKKLFVVKFVVYYWPFFYTAFIKPNLYQDLGATSTLEELHASLLVFFISHIAFAFGMLVLGIVQQKFAVLSEIRAVRKSKPTAKYSFLQVEAKSPAHPGDTDDYMELVLSLGFIMMFSVVMPMMAPLALVCNVIEIRLIAYRTSYVNKRPYPRGQEGIGSWSTIIECICSVAVMVNVALAVFTMHPIRDYSMSSKLAIFLVAEHSMLLLQRLVGAVIPAKSATQVVIEEKNASCIDEILEGIDHRETMQIRCTTPVDLPLFLCDKGSSQGTLGAAADGKRGRRDVVAYSSMERGMEEPEEM
eukprot:TRINITY_DN63883_c0_g1_i1.p1 TRINITY_DN63883_c0_g1~~TRINITY_DN63883_c0_g1_i1.p1  ORF type:complete len:763 (-),score=163.82 TRINITY_DN63883_c0_g1_i1:131-2419(-)